MQSEIDPPDIVVTGNNTPVKIIRSDELRNLGDKLSSLFSTYVSDRRIAELRWLRNLRQYLGQYDPDIDRELGPNRSRAYPRITRVKCVSVLSRVMNLMFPGNEKNWELKASPNPDMPLPDVVVAVQKMQQKRMEAGIDTPMSEKDIRDAVIELAQERANNLMREIDDQLQELGGDQSMDYIALNRKVVASGILYGLGVLRGPFVIESKYIDWQINPITSMPEKVEKTKYKPMFEFLPVWDFYPDMSAKTLNNMDGYFVRIVMSRHQVKQLTNRSDFFGDVINQYLRTKGQQGNYKAQLFETELRTMGVKINVNEQKLNAGSGKYEIIVWHGPVSAQYLECAGVDIPEDKRAEEIDAEIWMLDGNVIKADINAWQRLGVDVKTIHTFLFDEDDTSPIGNGLPNVMRDSQMSICASTRMLMDNASVVCGPNLELNTDLLRLDQDLTGTHAYKIWYREGMGLDAQTPAVKNITIDSHIDELLRIIELFMRFADMETFVGPATGGDTSKTPSEPMRTAAGASILRGEAALPFKDIIRNFDMFTQSVINSLVWFNRKFNFSSEIEGDYNVIARGATSLIAKELRGMQLDQLAVTLTPDEMIHVNERKMVEQKFAVRDLDGMLVSEAEAERRRLNRDQMQAKVQQAQEELAAAEIRNTLAQAYKNIAQGQKNLAGAETAQVKNVLNVLEKGLNTNEETNPNNSEPIVPKKG